MSEIIEFLKILASTPLPIILAVAGILSIILSFVEIHIIYIPLDSKPWLRVFGVLLLVTGIILVIFSILSGTISITSSPSGAEVLMDGLLKGIASPTLTVSGVSTGTHIVTCRLSGYSDFETPVSIVADRVATVTCKFQPNTTPTPTPATPTPTPTSTPTSTSTSTPTPTPTPTPLLSVSPDPILFNAGIVNSGESVSQMFSISNTGDGTLIWSISDDQPWITVDPSSGTNSGTVAVNINTAGLSSGSHKGTITITSNGGNKNGTVSLNIPPTPTPTPTPLEIKITSPKEGDIVPNTTTVSGVISGELPEGRYMWLFVNPQTAPSQWWPQTGQITPFKGKWEIQAGFGGPQDMGKRFNIAVILVDKKDNEYLLNYIKTGVETGNYPGIALPDSRDVRDNISVTKQDV